MTSLALLGTLSACREAGPSIAERAAAARAAEEAAAAKARADSLARIEEERLAALWRYQQATVGGGAQVTAAIFATDGVDVDGKGPKPVQLVFRDHRAWGRSSYLVLQAGDFACRPECVVEVTADDKAPERLAAWRPDTDEAIALFVKDVAALWRLAGEATTLRIAFPVRGGGTRTAAFETGGLDASKMPEW